MKVKAAKDVHIRSGEATRNGNANLKGILHKGFSIEVVETKTDGEDIDGNSIWYRDKNGDWYWSGGFPSKELSSPIPHFKVDPNFPNLEMILTFKEALNDWWIKDFNIQKIWKKYATIGSNANVAVLDSGYCSGHPLANNKLITGWNYKTNNSDFDDENGHGTSVVSVINNFNDKILGVAPGASIFIAKGSTTGPVFFINALNEIAKNDDVDIISISYDYSTTNKIFAKYLEPFKEAIARNNAKLIFASVGNYGQESSFDVFPAQFTNVIGVGSINKDRKISSFTNGTSITSIFAPGEDIGVLNIKNFDSPSNTSGTSLSTPYLAGVAALLVSFLKKDNPNIDYREKVDLTEILLESCDVESKEEFAIVNPESAFELLIKKLKS